MAQAANPRHPVPAEGEASELPPLPFRFGEFVVDRGRLADLPQIARIEQAVFPEPLSLPRLLALWARRRTCCVVVRRGRKVTAYIGFQLWGPMAHTISMAVHPAFRRRGLGTLVQRVADRLAAARGARWFMGEVRVSNEAQLRLLDRLGWQRIGLCPRFFGNGEDAVVVWRLLAQRLAPPRADGIAPGRAPADAAPGAGVTPTGSAGAPRRFP